MNIENEGKFSLVTYGLLSRTDTYKKDIENSMVIGYKDILKGVIMFEEVLKEINPDVIDDESVALIENQVYNVVTSWDEKKQSVNTYIHNGIYHCLLILSVYNNIQKNKMKRI